MINCGLINILRQTHEGVMPITHAPGSIHIYFALATLGLSEHVADIGLLDISVLQSDHLCLFIEIQIEGIFEQNPDKLAPHQFRNLKLDDPIISDTYRTIIHKHFECHNVYRRVKKISSKGNDTSWNVEDEAAYEKLDDGISESMKHA
jgi:hypothetical protein